MKKIKLIIPTIAISALILFYVIMHKNNTQLVIEEFEKYQDTEIIKDLWVRHQLSPPYEDINPLISLAKICKEKFFNHYPLYAQYAQIMAKQDALSLSYSKVGGSLERIIEDSGGIVALSDYVTQDVIYLYNIRNRSVGVAEENAKKLYNEFESSSQVKKTLKFMKPIQDKKQFEKLTEKEVVFKNLCHFSRIY